LGLKVLLLLLYLDAQAEQQITNWKTIRRITDKNNYTSNLVEINKKQTTKNAMSTFLFYSLKNTAVCRECQENF
jgi:hypothetical protein